MDPYCGRYSRSEAPQIVWNPLRDDTGGNPQKNVSITRIQHPVSPGGTPPGGSKIKPTNHSSETAVQSGRTVWHILFIIDCVLWTVVLSDDCSLEFLYLCRGCCLWAQSTTFTESPCRGATSTPPESKFPPTFPKLKVLRKITWKMSWNSEMRLHSTDVSTYLCGCQTQTPNLALCFP